MLINYLRTCSTFLIPGLERARAYGGRRVLAYRVLRSTFRSFIFVSYLPAYLASIIFILVPPALPSSSALRYTPTSFIDYHPSTLLHSIHSFLSRSQLDTYFFSRHPILIFPFWLPSFLARFVSSAFLCLYDLTPMRR